MENENKQGYDFLENPFVKQHFANTNIELLKGRHIQADNFYLYNLLDQFYSEMAYYYKELYDLVLERIKIEGQTYYYLKFPENSKGKLSDNSKHKQITETQVIFGIVFINMFYDSLFEKSKIFDWESILEQLTQSEYSKDYFRLLKLSENPTENDWIRVKNSYHALIRSFEELGWARWIDKENFQFEIKAGIHRMSELYKDEINNIGELADHLEG